MDMSSKLPTFDSNGNSETVKYRERKWHDIKTRLVTKYKMYWKRKI